MTKKLKDAEAEKANMEKKVKDLEKKAKDLEEANAKLKD